MKFQGKKIFVSEKLMKSKKCHAIDLRLEVKYLKRILNFDLELFPNSKTHLLISKCSTFIRFVPQSHILINLLSPKEFHPNDTVWLL